MPIIWLHKCHGYGESVFNICVEWGFETAFAFFLSSFFVNHLFLLLYIPACHLFLICILWLKNSTYEYDKMSHLDRENVYNCQNLVFFLPQNLFRLSNAHFPCVSEWSKAMKTPDTSLAKYNNHSYSPINMCKKYLVLRG